MELQMSTVWADLMMSVRLRGTYRKEKGWETCLHTLMDWYAAWWWRCEIKSDWKRKVNRWLRRDVCFDGELWIKTSENHFHYEWISSERDQFDGEKFHEWGSSLLMQLVNIKRSSINLRSYIVQHKSFNIRFWVRVGSKRTGFVNFKDDNLQCIPGRLWALDLPRLALIIFLSLSLSLFHSD